MKMGSLVGEGRCTDIIDMCVYIIYIYMIYIYIYKLYILYIVYIYHICIHHIMFSFHIFQQQFEQTCTKESTQAEC